MKIFSFRKSENSKSVEVADEDECGKEDEEEEDLLRFDAENVGTSITVHQHGLAVSRDVDSFCNGVVFSKANIFLCEYIYF